MTLRFAGYAALFDRHDAGRDVIRHGAFARSLDERRAPLPLYWQHRPELRIGWVEAASEDSRGLRVIATIENADGAAGMALRRGAVSGLSFGYRARAASRASGGRELLDVDLLEISLVSHPMQHAARVHMIGTNQAAIPGLGWFPYAAGSAARRDRDPAAARLRFAPATSRPPVGRPFS